VRNGSVVDLQIGAGAIQAFVSGSELYKVAVKVKPVTKARWKAICTDCAGAIDSLVELLQGRFSEGVMERICRQNTGLFPSPREIELSCSCPDWAGMCKHVAAVLYGIGARFDQQPELLFRLHEVNEEELIAKVGKDLPLVKTRPGSARILENEDLAAVFDLDMPDSTRSNPELSGVAAAKAGPAKARGNKKADPVITGKRKTKIAARPRKSRR
jgi:uncharacterized Zn finger protein